MLPDKKDQANLHGLGKSIIFFITLNSMTTCSGVKQVKNQRLAEFSSSWKVRDQKFAKKIVQKGLEGRVVSGSSV